MRDGTSSCLKRGRKNPEKIEDPYDRRDLGDVELFN